MISITPPPLHPHIYSIVRLCRKGALQTKREAFFKKMCFEIEIKKLKEERDGELQTVVEREFQILAA